MKQDNRTSKPRYSLFAELIVESLGAGLLVNKLTVNTLYAPLIVLLPRLVFGLP